MEQFILFDFLVANLFSAFAGGGARLLQLPVLIFLGCRLLSPGDAQDRLGGSVSARPRRHLREGLQRRFVVFILATASPASSWRQS